MNALTTTSPAGSNASALIPTSMRDAMELANVMAKAGFLARELQTQGGALFVIEQAMRWNMSPFAVAMETSFIQGKPMFSGKIVAAAVTSMGAVNGRLAYAYTGEGDNRTVVVTGHVRGEAAPREVTVRLGDAATANKVWKSQPDQQLAYHGARVWARRHTPEVMLGVLAPEEMEEAPQPRFVPNTAPAEEARPAGDLRTYAQTLAKPAEPELWPVLAPTGKLVSVPATAWPRSVTKALALLESPEAVREWRAEMGPNFASISETDAAAVTAAEAAIEARLASFDVPYEREPGEEG